MGKSDEVRRLLDERGVEWQSGAFSDPRITYYKSNGVEWCAIDREDGRLVVNIGIDVTPEQAIAATVEPNEAKEWRSVALGLFDALEKADLETAKRWLCDNDLLRQEIAYGDAKAATVGRPKVKKVRGMTYDEHGGEVYYLACSGCGEWVDGDLGCITEHDGPNFCHNCGGEFDGPLLCKRCGGLADLEYGGMCAECYEEVGA